MFDRDGNGTITAVEFRTALTTMGERFSEEEVDEMMMEADQNGMA